MPLLREVGWLAGVSDTYWNWSILFADFDRDEWNDIHEANGIGRDMTNEDFVTFRLERFATLNCSPF